MRQLKTIFLFLGLGTWSTSMAQTASLSDAFRNYNMYAAPGALNGAYISTFNTIENTKGRRYFFDTWAKGTVVNMDNNTIKVDSFFFNYDKISNTLIVSQDKKNIISLNKGDVKSFTLNDGTKDYYFVSGDAAIAFPGFLQVLSKSSGKYTLYKTNATKFVKADYHTNGLSESGNQYDEYVDEPKYYVATAGTSEPKPILLKSKSIKDAFRDEATKLNTYMASHKGENIDEAYVAGLVDYLNQ